MATFYIQLENKLLQISGELTAENISKALGYVPVDSSTMGIYATKDEVSDLVDMSMVEELSQKVDNITFDSLKENPFLQDGSGELNIVDEAGNIIAKIDVDGIHSVDFIADGHMLSQKADKSELSNYVTRGEVSDLVDMSVVTELQGKVNTLIDTDADKSVRDIAVDVLTETLVSETATEAYDTLAEMSAWIKSHPEDATAMNIAIQKNATDITNLDASYKAADAKVLTDAQEYTDNINFYTIKDNPIVDGEAGSITFVDETGYIGLKVTEDGIIAKDVVTPEHTLSSKADKSELPTKTSDLTNDSGFITINDIPVLDEYVTETELNDKGFLTEHQDISHLASKEWVDNKNYATEEDLSSIEFNSLQNNPLVEDSNGEFNLVDDLGNVGFKLNQEGLFVKDVIAGNHVLSNKANVSDISDKQDKLISGTNIKTINGTSILGSGDIEISGGGGDYLPLTGGTITGDLVITSGNGGAGNFSALHITADEVLGGKFIFDNDYWLRNEGYDLQYCDNNDEPVLTLTYKGDGTKFLSDDGTYKSSSMSQIITVTASIIRLGATESLVFDGRKYVCLTPMDSVELGDSLDGINGEIPGDYGEVSIIFTASESLSLSIPSSVLWANGQIPVIEEGVSYELSLVASKVNNAFVYKAVLTPFKSV